jgi:histidinol dehydrogenase
MPLLLNSQSADFAGKFRDFLSVKREASPDVEATVRAIIADVKARGDAALADYTAKFDRVAARFDVGDDGAHGRFDIRRGLALDAEEIAEFVGKIGALAIEQQRHAVT